LGTSNSCVDVFRAVGYTCRASVGQCDVAETCTGTSAACPADGFASVATSCTGASQSGACDDNAADHCLGTSNSCVDVFQTAGYTCTDDADSCTSDVCSGSSAACLHPCIPVGVTLQYAGDLFVFTAGPIVGTATVVLSAHVTPQNTCQDITALSVRFRVFQQNNLVGSPVLNQVAAVNSQGDAFIVFNSLTGQYTVRA